MKIIDRGKLFGYLNIFDVVIILLILAVMGGVLAKQATFKRVMQNYTVSRVQTQILADNVYPEQAEAVKPGAVVSELRSGEPLGTVKEVRVEPYTEKAPDSQGNWHMSPVPGKKNVIITVEGNLKIYDKVVRVGQVNVASGSKINITSPGFSFEAEVLKVDVLS